MSKQDKSQKAQPNGDSRNGVEIPDAFRGYEQSLPIALLQAREAVMNRFRPDLTERGLTDQQWRVIRALAEKGRLDATELAKRCCILTPSLSRIFRTLEARGFIVRERSDGDARRLQISLTENGRALFDEFVPHSIEIYRQIEAEFGADELDQLIKTLHRLRSAME